MILPVWMFSDILSIFKLVVQPDKFAKLPDLVMKYVLWFSHIEYDALHDVEALEAMMAHGVTYWCEACSAFSTPRTNMSEF